MEPSKKPAHIEHAKAVLLIDPPRVLAFLSEEERVRRLMLLDLDAEAPAADCLRMRLNIIFQPVVIRRGIVTPADYYVGTTGGTVRLSAPTATVIQHTGPSSLSVQHELSIAVEASASQRLTPEVKAKMVSSELDVKPGSIEESAKKTITAGVKFSSVETNLATTNLRNAIEWRIDSHRGEKAIRDFLVGNVYLEATVRWTSVAKSGRVQARPSDVTFFDSSKRRLSPRASLLMRFVLWKRGVHLADCEGIDVAFRENNDASG